MGSISPAGSVGCTLRRLRNQIDRNRFMPYAFDIVVFAANQGASDDPGNLLPYLVANPPDSVHKCILTGGSFLSICREILGHIGQGISVSTQKERTPQGSQIPSKWGC